MIKPERAAANLAALKHIHEVILSRYSQLFPNYVWTDAESAIDLMFAEIRSLQYELDHRPLEWRTVIGKNAPAYEAGFPG